MRLCRATTPALVVFLVLTSCVLLFSQTITEDGTIIKTHRFRPAAPARTSEAPHAAEPAKPGELSESAVEQIDALMRDKEARTPTQAKVSSRLLYTARMLRSQEAAPGIPVLYTNLELDERNNLFVDITAWVSDDLLQRMRSLGVRIVRSEPAYRSIRAFISPDQLETVASFPEVVFIGPRSESMTVGSTAGSKVDSLARWRGGLSPGFAQRAARVREKVSAQLGSKGYGAVCIGQGSVTSEGYATHRVADACDTFGVVGTGVKIGVLSDGVTSLALSQASGDLGPVTVLTGQEGAGDEGTAMLEIIHDLAPGATLFFATADPTIGTFAQNIRDLRTAGCDIIVDDVTYFVESPFQDGQAPSVVSNHNGGLATQAVNDVTADGAMYFSSAGNEGSKDIDTADTYEGDFVDGGTNPHTGPKAGKVSKFANTTSFDTITFAGGPVLLHWADPLGGSANDYDLFILDSTGASVVDSSTDIQNGTQDPIEGAFPNNDGDRVVVFKVTAAANRFFHVIAFGSFLQITTAGAVLGHAGASGAFAVGATPAFLPICGDPTVCPTGPFPNPFNATNIIEPFSSDGPRRIFFHADGTAITPGNFSSTGGTVLPKPEFTAADGVSVTGVGGFFVPFYGTSAAAPHAAAIAALVKSVDITQANSAISVFLSSTAIDIMGAGADRDSGAGIVMAFEAVQAATAPSITDLSPISGDVGTPVTISGKRFGATQDTSTVTFNGTAATPTSWSDTSIAVPVPAGATNGNVVVTVSGIASNGVLFTFTPNISGLSTNQAPAGTPVTVTGTNFGSTQGTSTVTFNGKTAPATTWSATSIVVNVPAGATTGNVVVTVNSIASNGIAFTVEDFSMSATLTDVTVTAGQSQTQHFTITPVPAFDAAITFACSGMPSKSSCTFTPSSVTPGGGTADVAMMVSTTAATTSAAGPALLGTWLPFGGLGLVLAMGVGTRKRSRKALAALGLFMLVPLLLAIASCGGGSHTVIPGTPPGTYNVTMRATSGSTSHSSTFKLIVQ